MREFPTRWFGADGSYLQAILDPLSNYAGETRALPHSALNSCIGEGIAEQLAEQVATGSIKVAEEGENILTRERQHSAERAVAIESRAAATISTLNEAGIATRVLKGLAVGHLDYERPELRPTGDIDVLVEGSTIGEADRLLSNHGFVRKLAEPYPGYDSTIGKGTALIHPDGFEIDLHRTLALGFYGTRLPIHELWGDEQGFSLAGVKASAMSRPSRFIHAALHMALAPQPRFIHLEDLRRLSNEITPPQQSAIIDASESWGCADPVALSIGVADGMFNKSWSATTLTAWAGARSTRPAERVWMSAYSGRFSSTHFRSATALLGVRPRTAGIAAAWASARGALK